jgi:haloalkane dehalogenase
MTSVAELAKKKIGVLGRQMAYVEEGAGDPIVFLHGNPTSSYLWRNVMPHLAGQGRLIAPDLIGMGDSDKLPDSGPGRYSLAEHRDHLFALLEALDVTSNVTLVLHDWGSALGFHWAEHHADALKGVAYMEAIVRPLTWADFPNSVRDTFKAFRSPAGDELILQKNLFVEGVLPGAIMRTLEPEEMDIYRKPFLESGEDRRPMLSWPRQIPIEGEPAEVVQWVESYGKFMESSPVPKLFVDADPAALLRGEVRDYCRTWPNQQEVTVAGTHFIQEDSPHEIGEAASAWLKGI